MPGVGAAKRSRHAPVRHATATKAVDSSAVAISVPGHFGVHQEVAWNFVVIFGLDRCGVFRVRNAHLFREAFLIIVVFCVGRDPRALDSFESRRLFASSFQVGLNFEKRRELSLGSDVVGRVVWQKVRVRPAVLPSVWVYVLGILKG